MSAPEPVTVVDVLVPVAVDTAYSYRVPPGLVLVAGDFVTVPLGPREVTGVVWGTRTTGDDNLKQVVARIDWPAVRPAMRTFLDWLARWTLAPRGMVLRLGVRTPEAAGPEPVRWGVRLGGPPPARMTPARARVLAQCAGGLTYTRADLAKAAGCGTGVIDGLVDEGALETLALPTGAATATPDVAYAARALSPAQAEAADALTRAVETRRFSVTLLEGVTGSGKTDVYFEAIAAALTIGRQALILLPEIALTTQFLDRFAARFGVEPAEWHSGVTPRRRARVWAGVADGSVRVVAGARSALFLPFADLGCLVVDEEHDPAYKQDDGVAYHARDMGVVRARLEEAAVVLASATPSIETRVNAARGRYGHLSLPTRFADRPMPTLAAIDLRAEGPSPGRWLAPRLVEAVGETVARGEQAMLFLNRRGYAPLTLCNACGHRFRCPNCTAWLTEHRFRQALVCHHCGHVERRPEHCPECREEGSLVACGPGVERLADEVATLFPAAHALVLSSDMPGGAARLRREFDAVAQGKADIVIGTQLVAKGHHFPAMTLVGVVDADVGLANGDPRAAERTFQLIQQVTGRAGRGDKPGRALIQTWQPGHPVLAALIGGTGEAFYAAEIAMREEAALPPFARLAALVVSGTDRAVTERHARALARAAHELAREGLVRLAPLGGWAGEGDMVLLGPAEAPLAMLRGRHRFRLLVKAPRTSDVQGFLRLLLASAERPSGNVRVAVDVDPQSFM